MMNILLTSAGRRSYLVQYFQQALKQAGTGGLVHAANSCPAASFAAADRQVITPLIYDEAYIPFLLDYCRRWEIGMVIPLFDIDVPVLAAHRQEFTQAGAVLVTANEAEARLCNDKWATCQFLEQEGLPVPKTYLTWTKALEEVKQGRVSWPLIIKPRWGMGSLGIFQADNAQELEILTEKSRQAVRRSYLKYEAQADLDHCLLIQEKLEGREFGLDVINDLQGRWQSTIVKEKLAMRAGETDQARTVENPRLEELGRKIGTRLGHRGNLDMDVMEANGQYYILEMNARFGGGYPFSHGAGVNLPLALIQWAQGREVPRELLSARPGVLAFKDIQILTGKPGQEYNEA